MQKNVEEYMTEKERREKRLMIYTEEIQKKVLQNSEQVIQKLVEERHRQHMTQQEIADITGICPRILRDLRVEQEFQHCWCLKNMPML